MALINLLGGRESFDVNSPSYNTNFVGMFLDDATNEIVFMNTRTGAEVGRVGFFAQAVGGLNQATLALAQYVALKVGVVLAVTNYNATTDGVTLQKVSVANGDYQDWIIVATENDASTGHIGQNPI